MSDLLPLLPSFVAALLWFSTSALSLCYFWTVKHMGALMDWFTMRLPDYIVALCGASNSLTVIVANVLLWSGGANDTVAVSEVRCHALMCLIMKHVDRFLTSALTLPPC